ncbi:hypothetical protein GCM10022379_44640 [Micromonospora maritima]
MKAGDLLHLTRAASPQFIQPILFRVIKRAQPDAYNGWAWIEGYQLDASGKAVTRREVYVHAAGVQLLRGGPQP